MLAAGYESWYIIQLSELIAHFNTAIVSRSDVGRLSANRNLENRAHSWR
jgi:hypothetical protein